jgi:hypothetical protein
LTLLRGTVVAVYAVFAPKALDGCNWYLVNIYMMRQIFTVDCLPTQEMGEPSVEEQCDLVMQQLATLTGGCYKQSNQTMSASTYFTIFGPFAF